MKDMHLCSPISSFKFASMTKSAERALELEATEVGFHHFFLIKLPFSQSAALSFVSFPISEVAFLFWMDATHIYGCLVLWDGKMPSNRGGSCCHAFAYVDGRGTA